MANSIAQKIDSNSLFSEQPFKTEVVENTLEDAKNCFPNQISSYDDLYKTKSEIIILS